MSTNQQEQKAPQQKNASQRIEDLEKGLMSMYQAFNGVAQDLANAKEALKLLGNKVSSIVTVSAKGDLVTEDSVNKTMIENNVAELKSKVDGLITQGILVNQETAESNSFLVGRELDDQGNIANPRLQFALAALQPDVQEKIKGRKAGDVVTIQEGKLKFELLEVYSIEAPKAAQAEATDAAPATAPTEQTAAPAATDAAPEAPATATATTSDSNTPTA